MTTENLIGNLQIMFDKAWKQNMSGNGTDLSRMVTTFVPMAMQEIQAKQPTIDAVPVVRCWTCHFCDPENHHCDHPMGTTIPVPRKLTDFCSYGEPKGERKDENV